MTEWFMPFVTKRQPLSFSAADREKLEGLRRSRSQEKRQVLRAAILLDCANGMTDSASAVAHGVNRHSVALCVDKFLKFGLEAALGDLPRPGKAAIFWNPAWPPWRAASFLPKGLCPFWRSRKEAGPRTGALRRN